MKPVVIIGIAVGCSVAAVLGILIGYNSFASYQLQQESEEYQRQLDEQLAAQNLETTLHNIEVDAKIKEYRGTQTQWCNRIFLTNGEKRQDCLNDMYGTIERMKWDYR